MAVSRVGGTKGKLTGQVGSTVFQVRKNADGSYTQITYEKGGRVETQLDPKVQAQRMCVAMVESLMRDLKPIATISYQAGKNKSQSLNSFAAQNLRLLQRDCKEHWYSDNLFVYPRHRRTDLNVRDLGGRWMISSGSLQKDCFDRQIFDVYPAATFKGDISQSDYFYGLWFDCPIGQMTVDQFRQAHRMTYNDSYCLAGFYQGHSYDPQEGSIIATYSNSYMIVKNNMKVPSSQVMDDATIMDLFVWKSDLEPIVLIAKDNSGFAIGILTDYYEYDEQFYYTAAFTINYATGKKQISTSFYENPAGGDDPWLLDAAPADVFGSWMGEPTVRPYPSPF